MADHPISNQQLFSCRSQNAVEMSVSNPPSSSESQACLPRQNQDIQKQAEFFKILSLKYCFQAQRSINSWIYFEYSRPNLKWINMDSNLPIPTRSSLPSWVWQASTRWIPDKSYSKLIKESANDISSDRAVPFQCPPFILIRCIHCIDQLVVNIVKWHFIKKIKLQVV